MVRLLTSRVWFWVLLLLTVVTLGASLTWPLNFDHGIFSWVAATVRSGGVPYRDAWNTTGPAAHLPYWFAQTLFGANDWGIRVIDAAVLLGATLVMARSLWSITSSPIAAWTALLLVLWYLSGTYYAMAQPDGWVTLVVLATLLGLWGGRSASRRTLWPWAGLVVGGATLIKPTYLGLLPVVLAPLGLTKIRQSFGVRLAPCLALFAVGFALPILVCLVWFSRAGAFDALVEVYVRYPIEVYGAAGSSIVDRMRGVVMHVRTTPLATLLFGSSVLVSRLVWRRHPALAVCLWSWIGVTFVTVVVQGKFFVYHWLPLYPPMAVLSAVGIHEVLARRVTDSPGAQVESPHVLRSPVDSGVVLGVWLALVALQCALHPAYESLRLAAVVTGVIDREAYDAGFGVAAPSRAAADYVRQRTTPQDRVAIWGWNAGVLYMAQRASNSRFGFNMPLVLGPGSAFRSRYRHEFLTAMRRTPPAFVVVDELVPELFGEPSRLVDFPEFSELVSACYLSDARFSTILVYRLRRDSTACALVASGDPR
jgi:4-amino-4-deoxy-L-arabinose transferase-like glycosyltransferase